MSITYFLTRSIRIFGLFALFFLVATSAQAADKLVFDSTNNYLGACQLTDTATWTIKEDLDISTFQIWYRWNSGETTLPVTLMRDGKKIAEFTATRAACDPYQAQWCNADYVYNAVLPKGTYTTKITDKRQCLKPGGTGAVRLYTKTESDPTDAPILSPTPSPAPSASIIPLTSTPKTAAGITNNLPVACACNQPFVIAVSAGASIFVSLLTTLILKKLG